MSIMAKFRAYIARREKELAAITVQLNADLVRADKETLARLEALEKYSRSLTVPLLDLSQVPRVELPRAFAEEMRARPSREPATRSLQAHPRAKRG